MSLFSARQISREEFKALLYPEKLSFKSMPKRHQLLEPDPLQEELKGDDAYDESDDYDQADRGLGSWDGGHVDRMVGWFEPALAVKEMSLDKLPKLPSLTTMKDAGLDMLPGFSLPFGEAARTNKGKPSAQTATTTAESGLESLTPENA